MMILTKHHVAIACEKHRRSLVPKETETMVMTDIHWQGKCDNRVSTIREYEPIEVKFIT